MAVDEGGNKRLKFDFELEFDDDVVIVELDGLQHFWRDAYCFSDAGCQRDLIKERVAIVRGRPVVRLLQPEVWDDKNGWRDYLTRAVAYALKSATPIVLTPDAPEYTRKDSAYAIRRADPTRISLGCLFVKSVPGSSSGV